MVGRVLIVCGIVVSLLLASGCQVAPTQGTSDAGAWRGLGGDNDRVLVEGPDGDLYVVRLDMHKAYRVDGLPTPTE